MDTYPPAHKLLVCCPKRARPPPASCSNMENTLPPCSQRWPLFLLCSVQLPFYSHFAPLQPLSFISRLLLCALTLPVSFRIRAPWTSPWPWVLSRLSSCPRELLAGGLPDSLLWKLGAVSARLTAWSVHISPLWTASSRRWEAWVNFELEHFPWFPNVLNVFSCFMWLSLAACCWLPKSHANRLENVGSV